MTLWHFTCDHGYRAIGRRGVLRPNLHPLIPRLGPVVWLTDDPAPERESVGLTSTSLTCDRMTNRYQVPLAVEATPWSDVRHLADPCVVRDLESHGEPDHWFVSAAPVGAVLA